MVPYRIVSIDGGGIRGILTARILERIDEIIPGFLKGVDLYAGTSTGGLLALGLGSGYTPAYLRKVYQELGNSVFADSLIDDVKDLGNLIGAQYSIGPLKKVMEKYFYGKHLYDLQKRVLVATFKLDNENLDLNGVRRWKMKFFHNYPGPESDGDQLVVDVGIRTSVVPAYFPTYQGYIDGGVAACNPAMCALAQALNAETGGQKLENVVLLSMGTGYNPHYLPVEDVDWGMVQWVPHILDIMLDGDIDVVNYQVDQLLGEKLLRINPILPIPIGMDTIKAIPDLLKTADQVPLDGIVAWIRRYFMGA
jgi:uncharacterized protein